MEGSSYGSFATYNILNPYHAVKWAEKAGLNEKGHALSNAELKASTTAPDANAWKQYSNWDLRRDILTENIQFAHIICLQEVALETIQQLQELTKPKGYQLAIAAYHASSQPMQQFGNAILYRAQKVQLKETFEIVHGTGETARSAACGIFQIGGKVIAVASMHLAGYYEGEKDPAKKQASKQAGFNELKTYVETLEKRAEGADGIVISADYNEDLSEAPFDLYRRKFLTEKKYQFDGNESVTEPSKNRRLDDVCYKPLKGTVQQTSMGLEGIQRRASDHLMTGTLIEFDS